MGLPAEKYPDWPAAMDRDWAQAFTGVSEAQLREWERAGKVRFRSRGPHGKMVALKADLERALMELFGGGDNDDGEGLFD